MKKWCLGLCACAWATLVSAATTFNDSTGDIDPGIGDGSGTLDIVSVEVSHTATDIVFALTVDGDIGLTDFGKYAIGIATGGTGTTIGNGWNRPIYLDSPIGGMNVWIGTWVDGGGGAELYSYDGTNWNGPGVLTDFSFTPGTQSRVSFTVAQADLGVSSGDMFYYDVYASGGMPSDSAVDALSNPDISITAWDQSYTSRTNDTGLSDYTLAATADVVPGQGPFAGGNAVLVTNAVPAIGNGADITNVLVGGVAATPAGQGANWVAFVAPATGSAGAKDVVIQSASLGNSTLAGAYTVNPAGEIGGSTSVTKWSAVGDAMVPGQVDAKGANNTIYGLGMSTSRVLYACGSFTNIGGSNCYRVARYDGTNWSDMEGGVFRVANVNCIVPSSDGIVYAGGYFTNIGGSYTSGGILANDGGTNSRAVAKWNGNQWEAMGDHVDPNLKGLFFASNVNGYVNTILPSTNGPVYAGGYYTNTDFTYHLNYVSKWTGTAWTNMQDGFRNVVTCMAEGPDGTVYAGGTFTNWAGAMSNQFQLGYVARWNGTSWTNMGLGLGNRVTCLLAARDGTIYAGGWFTNAANPSSGVMAPAQYVAKWTGTAWTNVGSGFNNWVYALAEGSDGTIYAGGSFTNTYDSDGVDTNAAKVRVSRIAWFDGARWQPLGGAETNGASDTVLALAADPVDGAVYAGGMFKTTFNEDGTSNNTWYVARYGSNTVSSIGVEPSTGSVTGGVEVVISGTNLGAGADITNVTICGACVASISSQSATQVVVVAGAGAPGLGDVVVFSTSFGETVKANAFTYIGPSFALLGTNGAAVASGAAPAAAAGTHFGEVLSGATVTNVFTITNAGNATLNLSWTTNGSAAFSVVSGPASVGAGAAADFAVAYASSGAAATAAVEVVHDAAFSPFLLHLASDSSLLAQTITFPALADQVTTGVVGLAATASSGLPVSFGVASGSASISGGTNLSFSGAGSVSIVASQGGDATYAPAPDATNTFNVAKAVATVTLTDLNATYDGTPKPAAATTEPAGLTVALTYDGSATAPSAVGSYAVTGTVTEANWQGEATGMLVISPITNSLTVGSLYGTPTPATGATWFAQGSLIDAFVDAVVLSADMATQHVCTGWSGTGSVPLLGASNAVSFNITDHSTLTWNWITEYDLTINPDPNGTVSLANGWYAAFTNLSITATASAGYEFAGWTGDIVTNANPLNLTMDRAYHLTPTFKAGQTIAFPPIPPQKLSASVGLAATGGGSGHPVTFAVTEGPGSIADDTNLTFSGVGDVAVVASQAGDATYVAAPDVTNIVKVFSATSDNGPFAGGNSVTVSNGFFGTITNVLVGGVGVSPVSSGDNWFTIVMPALDRSGPVDIVVQTTDGGGVTLANAYTYNPAGAIWNNGVKPGGPYVAGGVIHSLGVKSNGSIAAWGYNADGQCTVPAPNADFTAVAAGYTHSLGLKSDGTIAAWGDEDTGLCAVPAPNADFTAVAADNTHSLGLKSDGSIVAWGDNYYGQTDVPAPNADFAAVAAGGQHSLGLKSDGSIVAWGRNDFDQCTVPAPNADFVAIAAGGMLSLGLKADGTIVAWGENTDGQATVPAPNADFVAVACRRYHSLGLKSDGTIVAWGRNTYGQCTVPAPNANFVAIAAGWYHSLGLKSDGTIVAWGWNIDGQTTISEPNEEFGQWACGVLPTNGACAGGYEVVIAGTNLCNGADVADVTLCGVAAQSIQSMSATQIVVIVGQAAAARTGDVVVQSTSFGETVKLNGFTYVGAGIGISDPAFAPTPLGTAVTNFFTVTNSGNEALLITAATNDGAGAAMFDVSALTGLTVEPGTASNVPVIFTASAIGSFAPTCYVANNSPTPNYSFGLIGSAFQLSTNAGPFAGGNAVTITNGHFGAITNVLVGGAAAAILDSGASWVTVAMPAAGAAGMVDVAVQTSDNGETVLANAYAYNPAGWIGGEPDWSQWVEVEGLPTNRFQMSAAVLSNRIYAVGGANNYGTAKSNVYCFAGTSWTEVSSLPTGRINTVAGELNGSLIVAGGRRGPTGQCTNTYRFTGAGWEEVAGMPVAFADMAGATYAGAFYAIGGNDSGSQTNVYRFDGTNWTEVAGLPAPRDNMGAAACGDYLYAVGGVVSPGPTYHTNVYRYDGTNWTEVAGLPAPRGATGVAARDGALFVVGGQVEEEGEMGMPMTVLCMNVYRFDGTGWTEMAGLPQAEGMDLGLDLLANLDGVLYAFGSPLIVTNVYRYPAAAGASGVEPASGSWTGDYEVVIIGANLCNGTDVTNVTLCGVAAQSIQSMSATQIVVIAGQAAAAGLGDVVVQSTSYGETVKSNVFTYTAPEFAMEGGELDIASGEAARLETGADFAVVRVGASRTNEFRIRNPGDETLTISATVTNGAAAEMFAVLDETGRRGGGGGMPSQLDPGDSGLLGLVFAPTAAGAHSASLEFTHDGPDSPFVLNLAGMGYEVSAGEGPFAGGNTITVTGGAFGTITNVLVGGTSAAFTQTGPNEFTVTLPPAGADGAVDVVVQTSDNGDVALAGAYVYNPPGRIGFEGMICGWEELAGLPVAKYYLGAGSFQGSVYAVGGMQYVESWGFVPVTNVYRWDGTAWTEVEGLPGAASSLGVATFRDGLYALGGYSGVGVRTNVYRFDGTNWTEVAGLPAGRSQGAAAVWEDQLYYLGGWTNVYRYDGTNWTEVASLPESMVSVTASAWDGKLYAIGGFGDGLPLTAVYAYDGSGWTAAASLPVPMAHASSGVLEDGLHVWAGAYDNDEWTTNVYRFDGARWQLEGALPNGRYAVGGCVHDGALHAVGGFGPNGVGSEGATTNVYRSISCNLPGVEPSMGTWAGEYEVAIRGVDLGNGMDVTNVTLCGVPVASIVSQSATQIVVVAGAAAGPVVGDVRVFSTSFGETVGSDAFTYLRADQTIDFPAIPDQFATNATLVSATASSGLPVMFEVVGGPATLSETWGRREPAGVQSPAVATYSATGLVSIVARQAGGTNWNSAPSVTNTFRVRGVYALEIEPAPGATEPAAGSYSHGEGTVLTNAAITPATAGSTQYVCVGWTLSGHEPASGTETQMVMTVTNDAVLTWLWTTNYQLATASAGHGSVQPESGWQPAGVATQVLAEADEYFVFANWTGDASGSDNPLALTMDAAKSVTANFAALYTTNRPTPLWWLADHGIAGDFEAAVNGDPDEDGVSTGDEWVMDTDPTNGASFLAFDAVWPLHGSNCWDVVWTNEEPPYDVVTNQECEVIGHVYRWRTSTGRVYGVQGAAGMHAPWLDLDGMTNLMPQGPELTVTNPATDPERMRHYRVRVRLP